MDEDQASVETMLHPVTGQTVEVVALKAGDTVEATDIYRSATTMFDGPGGALGQWFVAGDVLDGSVIGPACNVQFMRPTVLDYDDDA